MIAHPVGASASAIEAGASGRFGGYANFSVQEPVLWSGPQWQIQSLAQQGTPEAGRVRAMTPDYQVGRVDLRAVLWNGSPQSRVELHPPQLYASDVHAAFGDRQFGYTSGFGELRAAMWTGTAASWQDLHPIQAQYSMVHAAYGLQQGGTMYLAGSQSWHAAIWSGAASSVIDLNPQTASESEILAMGPGQQAGFVYWTPSSNSHAVIWSGTAASAIDVNPSIAFSSAIYATNGEVQVGYASHSGGFRAGLWRGTAESFIDLHQFLPAQYTYSEARAITESNGLLVVGGWASIGAGGPRNAVVWTVPAPPTIGLLTSACLVAFRRCRRPAASPRGLRRLPSPHDRPVSPVQ